MSNNDQTAEIVKFDTAKAVRESTTVDPLNFVHVGEYLASIRQASRLSVDQVSAATQIKPQFIRAIEALDCQSLPARPFAIGFVKAYAEALDLDEQPIVDRFRKEAGFAPRGAGKEGGSDEGDGSQNENVSGEGGLAHAASLGSDIHGQELNAGVTVRNGGLPAERAELPLLAVAAIVAFIIWCGFTLSKPTTSEPLRVASTPITRSTMPPGIASDADSFLFESSVPVPAKSEVVDEIAVERFEPVYPPRCLSAAAGEERVEVAFTVRIDGSISGERVMTTSNDCFSSASLAAIRLWRFEPREVDGVKAATFDRRQVFLFSKP
ncbi:MAG: helix-turn-helix domain-containing protein [Pseudomonadota bacterium]